MKFDSNRAWLDAMAAVSANRQVLLPVAGVFFLLPTMLSTVFLSDVQTQIFAAMNKPEQVERIVADHMGLFLGFGFGGALVQGIGYLALMVLLSDRARPTVGQAIMAALRALPTLVGTALLALVAMFLTSMLLGLVVGGLIGLAVGPQVASAMIVVILMVLMIYASVKLSLVMPVVVNEGVRSPLAALARSWQVTRHNSLRLFGFFALLAVAYVAISFTLTMVVLGPVALIAGEGEALKLFSGVVSGAISAVSGVILSGVLAHSHRQLAGPSADALSRPFR